VQSALETYLHEHLPFAASAPIEARWSGIMAFSADGLPLAGPLPNRAGGVGARRMDGTRGSDSRSPSRIAWAERIVAGTSGDAVMDALSPARFG